MSPPLIGPITTIDDFLDDLVVELLAGIILLHRVVQRLYGLALFCIEHWPRWGVTIYLY